MRKAFGITLAVVAAAIAAVTLWFFIMIPIATEPMTSEVAQKIALGILMFIASSVGAWAVYDDANDWH